MFAVCTAPGREHRKVEVMVPIDPAADRKAKLASDVAFGQSLVKAECPRASFLHILRKGPNSFLEILNEWVLRLVRFWNPALKMTL